VSGDINERAVPGGALNLNSTGYGDLPPQRKIPTAEPGIESGTSWLVVRSSNHQAMRLISFVLLLTNTFISQQCKLYLGIHVVFGVADRFYSNLDFLDRF
jgi:hypothetical protein